MTPAPTPSLHDFVALCDEACTLIRQLAAMDGLDLFPVPTPGGRISAIRAAGRIRKLKGVAEELQRLELIEPAVRSIASSASSINRPLLEGEGRGETQSLSPYDKIIIAFGEWRCRNGEPAYNLTLNTRSRRSAVDNEAPPDEEYCLVSLSSEFDCLLDGTDRLSDLVDNGRELLEGIKSARRAFRSHLRHLLLIHDREFYPIRHPNSPRPRAFVREKCRQYRTLFPEFVRLLPVLQPVAANGVDLRPNEDTEQNRKHIVSYLEALLDIPTPDPNEETDYTNAVKEGKAALATCSPDQLEEALSCCGSQRPGLDGVNSGNYDSLLEVLKCRTLADRRRLHTTA